MSISISIKTKLYSYGKWDNVYIFFLIVRYRDLTVYNIPWGVVLVFWKAVSCALSCAEVLNIVDFRCGFYGILLRLNQLGANDIANFQSFIHLLVRIVSSCTHYNQLIYPRSNFERQLDWFVDHAYLSYEVVLVLLTLTAPHEMACTRRRGTHFPGIKLGNGVLYLYLASLLKQFQ